MIPTLALYIDSLPLVLLTWPIIIFLRIRDRSKASRAQEMLAGFILAAGFSAIFIVLLGPAHLFLALALGAFFTLSPLHPAVGTVFLMAFLVARPWTHTSEGGATMIIPKLLAGTALLSWVVNTLRRRDANIVWGTASTLFVLYVGWLMIGVMATGAPEWQVQMLYESFYPIAMLCFLILNSLRTRADIDLFVCGLSLAAAGVIGAAIYFTASTIGFGGENRLEWQGYWGNSNDLAALICLVTPLTLYHFFVRHHGFRNRFIGAVLFSVLLFGLWATQSRGAIAALAISGLAYLFFVARLNYKQITVAILIGVSALVLATSIERNSSDLDTSKTSRLNFLVTGLRMAKEYPIFGIGIGNYERRYEQFTTDFTAWGPQAAHNSWVLALAESGPIGLLLFSSLYFLALKSAWRIRHSYPEFFLALISYGVAISFLSHTYLFPPYLLCALSLAAERTERMRARLPTTYKLTEV